MSRGHVRSKATLGDAALDFRAQWEATKLKTESSESGNSRQAARSEDRQPIEETLASWKRGGAQVVVKKGTSIGLELRKQRQSAHPPRASQAPLDSAQTRAETTQPAPARDPEPQPEALPLRRRLAEASADVRHLRILAAKSHPLSNTGGEPVVEAETGPLAILGLDFGTAFSKAIVRWSQRHYAVDWSGVVEGDEKHLLASVFSEGPAGVCMLGALQAPGWTVRDGIKLGLLSAGATTTDKQLADAVIFVALSFRYVHSWLQKNGQGARNGLRWRLHLGLPTKSWDSNVTTDRFKTVAQAARLLACAPGAVTRVAALAALAQASSVERPAVDVLPEFACQLYSYLQSPERSDDLHALVDVGAGTLDAAFFNVFSAGGDAEPILPIFSSEVEDLGAHYLIAALAGRRNSLDWVDADSSLSDDEVARKLQCSSAEVCRRRSLYLSAVADVFNAATRAAQRSYPNSRAFRGWRQVLLFLCGGGSRIPSLQRRFERIAQQAAKVYGIRLRVSRLVRPKDIIGDPQLDFDRLSVAYGLSQLSANIGSVMRSASLDPIAPREIVTHAHRDDDR